MTKATLKTLVDLRKQKEISQKEVAQWFGLKNYNTVSQWESGMATPPQTRRLKFIGFLWDQLGLKQDEKQFLSLWNDVMVETWEWEPLSKEELQPYIPSMARFMDRTNHIAVPFLAPPLPPYELVGRKTLLIALKKQLFAGGASAISALTGLPGVGKTALAVALAHDREVLEHFRDGVLWAGLGKGGDAFAFLGNWALELGIPREELAELKTIEARSKSVHAKIGMRHILLVIDDAWEPETALAFKVGGANCAHLVTTRIPEVAIYFAGTGVTPVHELPKADSLVLLSRLAPQAIADEADAAANLVGKIDGLPLGLILMGNYLAVQAVTSQSGQIETALEKLQSVAERLKLSQPQSPVEGHPSLSISARVSLSAVITVSVEALPEPSRQALYALSIFPPKPNSFSQLAATVISSAPDETIATLSKVGLLEDNGKGRYMLHQTITDYASLHRRDECVRNRMVEFFTDFVENHQQDYDKLDPEKNNILLALQVAFEQESHTALIQGVNAFYHYLHTRGLYQIAHLHLERAHKSAWVLSDVTGLATLLLYQGVIAERLGNFQAEKEYLLESLALARSTNNRPLTCEVLMNLSTMTFKTGDTVQAEQYCLIALNIAQGINNHEYICKLLNNLGIFADIRGDYTKAEKYYKDSLAAGNKTKNLHLMCAPLQNIGVIALNRGNYQKATKFFLESLGIARQIGNSRSIFHVLSSLGAAAFYQGNYAQAENYWQQGLTIARETGDLVHSIAVLGNLGDLEGKRGNFSTAEEYVLGETLLLARSSGFQEYLCYLLDSISNIMIEQKRFTEANKYLGEGISLARSLDYNELICSLLGGLGTVATHLGEYVQAETYLTESLTIARQIGNPVHIGRVLNRWGELYLKIQQVGAASEAFLETLHLAQEKGIKELYATALFGLAQVKYMHQDITQADHLSKESQLIFQDMGHHNEIRVRDWRISVAYVG